MADGGGYGVADAGDLARKPIGDAIGEAAAEWAAGAGMDSVDENGRGDDKTRKTREETGVGQMGMQNLGMVAMMPAKV